MSENNKKIGTTLLETVIHKITDRKHCQRIITYVLQPNGVANIYGYDVNALICLAVQKCKLWFVEDLLKYNKQKVCVSAINKVILSSHYMPSVLKQLLSHCTDYDRAELLRNALKDNKPRIASVFSVEDVLDAAHIDLAELSNRLLVGKYPHYLSLLIESGASVNGLSSCTPISSTLQSSLNSVEKSTILHILIDSGASVNHLTYDSNGPIHTATRIAMESGNIIMLLYTFIMFLI